MSTKRLARFNLVVVFPDLASAETALEALWDAGLTADEVSLLGREIEMKPGTGEAETTQGTATSGVAKAGLAGIGGGSLTGGALGALVGAGVTAIPGIGLALGPAILYSAIAGGATGGIAGGLIGAEAGARKTMMWEQTLNPLLPRVDAGDFLLGVHSDEEHRVETAAEALEQADDVEPLETHRLDAAETFHPPGDLAAVADRTIPSTHPERAGGEMGMDQADEEAPAVGMAERGGGPTRGDRPAPGGEDPEGASDPQEGRDPEQTEEDDLRPR